MHDGSTWRAQHPVLVCDAQALGSIAAIRSLGRAGYPVHAMATQASAMGLRSSFAQARTVCPPYSDSGFIAWLSQYVRRNRIEAIVPSEGMLLALRPHFDEFAALLPCPSQEILFRGLSKFDVARALMGGPAGAHLPPTLLVDLSRELPAHAELERLGAPLFLKLDALYGLRSGDGLVERVDSAQAALDRLAALARDYRFATVQSFVPGRGVGAFFLRWEGRILAEFMHRRLHEVPHTGGASSLRESWFHEAIRTDALQKLAALDWQGVAMMEYRWDARTGEYYLMEMNGRFWGSLHLALYAGVDFPALLLDAFHGNSQPAVPAYQRGVRCRNTFPGDMRYLWSRLKDSRLPAAAKAWSAVECVLLSLDPRVRADLLFPADRSLYWESLRRWLREQFWHPSRP